MTRVFISSPYRATPGRSVEQNVHYAVNCARAVNMMGHHPFVPHLAYRFLDEDVNTNARALELCLLDIKDWVDELWYFTPYWSPGMVAEIAMAHYHNKPVRDGMEMLPLELRPKEERCSS